MVNGIIVIIMYFSLVSISMFYIKNQYKMYNNGLVGRKIGYISIIIIAVLFSLLNWICTVYIGNGMLGSDRLNYSVEFTGVRSVGSTGLQFIFDTVNRFGGNVYFVFYFTTFVCVFTLLWAYRTSKIISPRVLFLFFITDYVFFTFSGLKQSYSVAISCLFIVNLFENNSKFKDIISIFLLVLACLFHSSAFVLLPIFIIYKFKNKNGSLMVFFLIISVLVVSILPRIMIAILPFISNFLPILSQKIVKYFQSDLVNENWSTIFKYVPLFYITFWGFVNRERLKAKKNYNTLMMISFLGLLLVCFSIEVYWFQRLRYYFFLPTFILYDFLLENEQIKGNMIINNTIVCGGMLFFMVREILLIFVKWGAF